MNSWGIPCSGEFSYPSPYPVKGPSAPSFPSLGGLLTPPLLPQPSFLLRISPDPPVLPPSLPFFPTASFSQLRRSYRLPFPVSTTFPGSFKLLSRAHPALPHQGCAEAPPTVRGRPPPSRPPKAVPESDWSPLYASQD